MDGSRKTQLRHIHDYIAQDSLLYAKRVSEALVKKTIGLNELPRKGRKVPELDVDAVRELSLYSTGFCMRSSQIPSLRYWRLFINGSIWSRKIFRESNSYKV